MVIKSFRAAATHELIPLSAINSSGTTYLFPEDGDG
jgi:hypothetical protein